MGLAVITPSGRHAIVVGYDERLDEATVEWDDGERGCFRLQLLRPAPR